MSLERALAALDAGEDQVALAALVEAWRERRSVQLAELVELLDSRQRKRPFATILTFQVKSTIDRLRPLVDADDPRLATFVVDALANPPFTSVSSRPFWQLVFDIALALRDPRIRQKAGELRKEVTRRFASSTLRAHLLQGIGRLESQEVLVRDPTEDEARLETEIGKRLEKIRLAKRREHELLAEIYADPYADGPRLVYADVLLERGDPRGELIALQFERRDRGLDDAKAAREAELLGRYMKQWLGDLGLVVTSSESQGETRFERGFLAIADIYQNAGKKLPLTWNDPIWATVEELRGAHQDEVVRHARLFALRRLECLLITGLPILAGRPALPYLSELVLGAPSGLASDLTRELVAHCDNLAALRDLTLVTMPVRDRMLADARWILGSPVAERLERLVIASPHASSEVATPSENAWLLDEAEQLTAAVPVLGIVPLWSWESSRGERPAPVLFHRDADGRYRRAPP